MNSATYILIFGMFSFWILIILLGIIFYFRKDLLNSFRRKKLKNKGFGYVFIIGTNKNIDYEFKDLSSSSIRTKNDRTRVVESECMGSFDGFPAIMYLYDDIYPVPFNKISVEDGVALTLRDSSILDNLILKAQTNLNYLGLVKNNKYILYALIGLVILLGLNYQTITDLITKIDIIINFLSQAKSSTPIIL